MLDRTRTRRKELQFLVRTAVGALGTGGLLKEEVLLPSSREDEGFLARWMNRPHPQEMRVAYAKELVRIAARQYEVPLPRIAIRFSDLGGSAAGTIRSDGRTWFVDLCATNMHDDERMLSIVAHEMAHYVLTSKGIWLQPLQRNEELTDTVAALAGFGDVMTKAKKRTWDIENGLITRRVENNIGYLPIEDLRTLVRARRMLQREEPKSRWAKTSPGSIVRCWFCGRQLRVPEVSSRIRISCPSCTAAQILDATEPSVPQRRWLRWLDEARGLS